MVSFRPHLAIGTVGARCPRAVDLVRGVLPNHQTGAALIVRRQRQARSLQLGKSRQSDSCQNTAGWKRFRTGLLSICLLGHLAVLPAQADDADALLNRWLTSRTNVHTWSAEFVQTRTLKALSEPIKESGRVWFAAPNRFRWEIGSPAKTIAVRQPEQMLVIYPRLKRAEKYSLAEGRSGVWRDTLSLLEAGFPRDRPTLEEQYKIESSKLKDGICVLALKPKSIQARRMMPRITVGFGTNDLALHFTELEFADGSTMRNDFSNAVMNPEIPPGRFDPPIEPDYKVVEPLKNQSRR